MATGSNSQHIMNNDNKYTRWTIAQTQRSTTGWTHGRIPPRRSPCLESSPTTMSCFLACQRSQGIVIGNNLGYLKVMLGPSKIGLLLDLCLSIKKELQDDLWRAWVKVEDMVKMDSISTPPSRASKTAKKPKRYFSIFDSNEFILIDVWRAESEKPCQRVSNADRKVFAIPESFCHMLIIG